MLDKKTIITMCATALLAMTTTIISSKLIPSKKQEITPNFIEPQQQLEILDKILSEDNFNAQSTEIYPTLSFDTTKASAPFLTGTIPIMDAHNLAIGAQQLAIEELKKQNEKMQELMSKVLSNGTGEVRKELTKDIVDEYQTRANEISFESKKQQIKIKEDFKQKAEELKKAAESQKTNAKSERDQKKNNLASFALNSNSKPEKEKEKEKPKSSEMKKRSKTDKN